MSSPAKITPFLWFADQAEEAAQFYVSHFEESAIGDILRYPEASARIAGLAAGSVMTVNFRIAGQPFTALNGGPHFTLTPAISFFVNCADAQQVDELFARLADGGTVLMPLQAYPFSQRYAWVADRFGVSWQLNAGPRARPIAPCLLFVGALCGRAEEAVRQYTSIFPDSGIETIWRYGEGDEAGNEGRIKHATFTLAGQEFRAMDGGLEHAFTFTEAVSLQVHCDTQAEVDHYWERLGDGGDPTARRCGWLKDRFGASWQIVPTRLFDLLADPEGAERVTEAMLQMRKLDIAGLEAAWAGHSRVAR